MMSLRMINSQTLVITNWFIFRSEAKGRSEVVAVIGLTPS